MKKLSIIIGLFLLTTNCCFADNRLPGTSIADAVLQRDSILTVITSAYWVSNQKGCRDISIIDTQVTKMPDLSQLTVNGKNHGVGPWAELWTVKVCKAKVYVPINFIPDDTGTAFVVNNKDIKVQK